MGDADRFRLARGLGKMAGGALVAWLGWSVMMVSSSSSVLLGHTAVDDAFYYLETARRWGQHPWPTFDGVHVTTGFHPLWLWVSVGVARLVGDHPWVLLRVEVALSSVLMLLAVVNLARWLDDELRLPVSMRYLTLAMALGSAGLCRYGLMAMEGPLALLLATLWLREDSRDEPRWWRHGLLGALAMLARLDMVLLIGAGLALRVREHGRSSLRFVLASGAVTTVAMGPYLAWNYSLTGHFGTISSATKAFVVSSEAAKHGGMMSVGHLSASLSSLVHNLVDVGRGLFGGVLMGPAAVIGAEYPRAQVLRDHPVAVLVVLVVTVIAVGLVTKRFGVDVDEVDVRGRVPRGVLALVLSAALHLLLAAWMLTGQAGPWYWGLEFFAMLAVMHWGVSRWPRLANIAAGIAVLQVVTLVLVVAGTFLGAVSGKSALRRSFSGAMWSAARAVDRIVPEGASVGSCNAGTLGYFTEKHRIVNMDGLVNDWSLLHARRRGDVRGWMTREHIGWYADCIPASKIRGYASYLGYRLSDIEVKYDVDGGKCRAVIWKLPTE